MDTIEEKGYFSTLSELNSRLLVSEEARKHLHGMFPRQPH